MRRLMVLGLVLGMVVMLTGQATAVPIPLTINFIDTATGIDIYKNGSLFSSVVGDSAQINLSEFTYSTPISFSQNILNQDGITFSGRVVWEFLASGTNVKFGYDGGAPASGLTVAPAITEDGSLQALLSGAPWTSKVSISPQYSLYTNFQSQVNGTQVPEPSTLLLLGSGLVGLVGYGRRRLKK